MTYRKNLVNEKFGSLTVIEENGRDKRKSIVWLCECECGGTRNVITNLLKSNKVLSCGCKNKKSGPPRNDKDVVGKKFNSFFILRFDGKDKWRQILYKYRCDCGNEGTIPRCKIGKLKKCPQCRYGGYKEITQRYWGRIERQAIPRNIKFDLKIEDAWEVFEEQNRKCALTGIELYFPRTRSGRDQNASLDRIDSVKGYVKNNIQWVHKKVNELKWDLTSEELLYWCNLIVKNSKGL